MGRRKQNYHIHNSSHASDGESQALEHSIGNLSFNVSKFSFNLISYQRQVHKLPHLAPDLAHRQQVAVYPLLSKQSNIDCATTARRLVKNNLVKSWTPFPEVFNQFFGRDLLAPEN